MAKAQKQIVARQKTVEQKRECEKMLKKLQNCVRATKLACYSQKPAKNSE